MAVRQNRANKSRSLLHLIALSVSAPAGCGIPECQHLTQLGTGSEDPYRYQFRLVYCCAMLSARTPRFRHTRRSAMTLMVAARTSAQSAAFDTVSIVPSTRI